MLKIMLEPLHQNLKIIDYEIDNKIEYTFETIKFLKKQYSATSLNMIIGLDQFNSISSWKNHKYILSNVNLLVISRPGYSPNDLIGNVKFIDNIKIDISSKEIRDNISNLKKIPSMFDNDVYDYIIKNNLYI